MYSPFIQFFNNCCMRTIRPFLLSLLTVLLSSLCALAQTRTVTGRVIDAGSNAPIPNVSINVEGSPGGATTDLAGRFTLKLAAKAKLVLTHVNYGTTVIKSDGSNNLTIRMEKSAATELNDVVVIGYGVRKKATLTGSIV